MKTIQSARIIVEVRAGIIPEQSMSEYTKRWVITSEEWDSCESRSSLLSEFNGKAQGYAGMLMLSYGAVNWVRTDWIYL